MAATATPARCGVVLCPPLLREAISAHYPYRLVAEAIAERGMVVVRFDYDGTGDSAGSESDPGRVKAYLESIGHAIDLIRAEGVTEIALVGLRMGAVLAAHAAADHPDVSALVLWDPCATGREFFRQQDALFRVRFARARVPAGTTQVPGFLVSRRTVAEFKALKGPDSLPHVERALLLTREGRAPAHSLYRGMDADRVDLEVAHGQEALMDVEPLHLTVPECTWTVVDWLGQALPAIAARRGRPAEDPRSVAAEEPSRPIPLEAGRAPRTATATAAATATATATLATPGRVTVRERIRTLGPTGLFAIETTADVASGAPTVLFLNSGNDSHIGPSRMWVDLSRQWASYGFRCVRFDISGLGDSPVRVGQQRHVIRQPEAFDDVEAAVMDLGVDPAEVILVGLCSGAYQALESALELKPKAALVVNPLLRFRPPELVDGQRQLYFRRRLAKPIGTLVGTYRSLPQGKILRWARAAYLAGASRLNRLKKRKENPIERLIQLSASGTDVLCLCGEMEAAVFFNDAPGEPWDSPRFHDVMQVLPGLDHALVPFQHRSEVMIRLTRHLVTRHLERSVDQVQVTRITRADEKPASPSGEPSEAEARCVPA